MPRTVNPEQYAARRLVIIDAALTCFARTGYDASTTAMICAEAGIGSGTFFHYFPTKASVLVGIIECGTAESVVWFEATLGRKAGRGLIEEWIDRCVDELVDPRVAGFVRAVGSVLAEPTVLAALAADDRALHQGVLALVESARAAGEISATLPDDQLTRWLLLLTDGFTGRIATDATFDVNRERSVLHAQVAALLA